MTYLCVREVVVRLEGRIECRDQVEQGLSRNGVTQRHPLVAGVASTTEERRHVGQRLWR